MRVAQSTGDCSANHSQAQIPGLANVLPGNRRPETGPTGSRLEFCVGAEQGIIAADAAVEALVVQIPISAGIRHLRIGVTRDLEFAWRKLLSPLVLSLNDFGHAHFLEALSG